MFLTANQKEKMEGSITVFLSLILLLILSLICTTIETSRIASADARCKEITYMALDSCFSGYAREVFEDYGIMVLWQNEDDFISIYQDYVTKNSDYQDDFKSKPIDLLSVRYQDVAIEEIKRVTDSKGALVENQIYEYMKLALSEDVINAILQSSTELSQNDDINDFNSKMEQCSDTLSEVENTVGDIYNDVQEITGIEYSPKDVLTEMKTKLEEIKAVPPDSDYNKAVRDNLFEVYKQEFRKYKEWEEKNIATMTEILVCTNDYQVYTTSATQQINTITEELEKAKEENQTELYDVMLQEVKSIREEILSFETDKYNVMNNKQNIIEQKKITDRVKSDMQPIMEGMKELDYSGNKLSNYEGNEAFVEQMCECVEKAVSDIEGYNKNSLSVQYESKGGEKKENEIVEFVKQIKEDGIMNYIAAGDLSEKKIDTSQLPSKQYEKQGDMNSYGAAEDAIRKALVGQYIFDKFYCYTDKQTGGYLDYEIEYILAGKQSDKENLSEVVDKLLAIREGFNLIYLLKDTAKREEAYAMAMTITGFTGMPVLIRTTQFLILGAWAYAESVVDVKDLLEGYKVKVMKGTDEWNLSLTGIQNLASTDKEKENRTGLSYEDYLRFLLFCQNHTEQVYKTLDIMELNIRSRYNDNFRFSECISNIKLKTTFKVNRLFTGLAFTKNYIQENNNGFMIAFSQVYGY